MVKPWRFIHRHSPLRARQKNKKKQLMFKQKMGRISSGFPPVFLLVSNLDHRICRLPIADRFTFNHTVKLWDSREMFGKPRGNVWDTIPETNSSHLKIDLWKRRFLLETTIFRCYVSFKEGRCRCLGIFFGCREGYLHVVACRVDDINIFFPMHTYV